MFGKYKALNKWEGIAPNVVPCDGVFSSFPDSCSQRSARKFAMYEAKPPISLSGVNGRVEDSGSQSVLTYLYEG